MNDNSLGEVRDIPGFPRYRACSVGAIISTNTKYESSRKGLKQYLSKTGYLQISVVVGHEKKRTVSVHNLIALAFIGPRPDGMQINHKDGNKTNNRPENLEYVTPRQNIDHSKIMGLSPRGERSGRAKLTAEKVVEVRRLVSSGMSCRRVAKMMGVCPNAIGKVIKGESWTHI